MYNVFAPTFIPRPTSIPDSRVNKWNWPSNNVYKPRLMIAQVRYIDLSNFTSQYVCCWAFELPNWFRRKTSLKRNVRCRTVFKPWCNFGLLQVLKKAWHLFWKFSTNYNFNHGAIFHNGTLFTWISTLTELWSFFGQIPNRSTTRHYNPLLIWNRFSIINCGF